MLHPPSTAFAARNSQFANVVYLITFSGSYYTTDGSGQNTKQFNPITVKMTQYMVNEGPLSVFKNEIAPELFPRMYPDFSMLHKYRVDHTEREDGGPVLDINLMNRGEITALISREGLPITVSLYKTVDALREAIFRYLQDDAGFRQEETHKRSTLNKTAAIAGNLQALNADLFNPLRDTEKNELQNQIVNQPSLYDVLATHNAVQAMSRSEGLPPEVNTTGIQTNALAAGYGVAAPPTLQPRGYVENASQDTFPDGVPTIAHKPIINPHGTQPTQPPFPQGF